MDEIFEVLSDGNRRKIIALLALSGEMTVTQMQKHLDISQPTVSAHLSLLKKSGLVDCRTYGKWRVYCLNISHWKLFMSHLETFFGNGLITEIKARKSIVSG